MQIIFPCYTLSAIIQQNCLLQLTASNLLPAVLGDFEEEAQEAIDKCSELAFDKSYKFFALGYNGKCQSGPKARDEYHRKPATKDSKCPNGISIGKRIAVYTFGKFPWIY